MGMHKGWSEGRKSEGNAWVQVFIDISVGKAKQNRLNRLGLSSLNNISMLLFVGFSPSCLISVPEVILWQRDSGSTCESSIKEVVDWYGLWTGWCAYEWHSHKGVLCYLEELACPVQGWLPLASKTPIFQNIIKYRQLKYHKKYTHWVRSLGIRGTGGPRTNQERCCTEERTWPPNSIYISLGSMS